MRNRLATVSLRTWVCNLLISTLTLDNDGVIESEYRCDSTQFPSCGHRHGAACRVCRHPLHVSHTIYARFCRQTGFQIHRSQCSEFLGLLLFPQGQTPYSASPRLSPGSRTQTGLECNRGTIEWSVGSDFRQRNRGTHLLHIYGVPSRTKSIRNGHFARPHISVGWMDGAFSSSVALDHPVDDEHTAPRRPSG